MTTGTYRMQLYPAHRGAYGNDIPAFGFDQAAALTPYLSELGIEGVYLPPIAATDPGSTHGYNVADHSRINPEIGGLEGFKRFTAQAQANGQEQIVDIVPNHMSTGSIWWQDVLANGPASPYAGNFDIDWKPPHAELTNKVLVPVLGGPYAQELKDIKIQWLRGELRAGYWAEYNDPFKNDWPLRAETVAELKQEIARDPDALDKINADPARVDAILQQQHYVLAHYTDANEKLNYRCFFDIHGLPSLRIDKPEVFEQTHKLVLDMMKDGAVKSVRVDHPDGLTDPAGYEEALTAAMPANTRKVFEKIYEQGEHQAEWNIDGDTGYRFMSAVSTLLIDARNDSKLTEIYQRFTGEDRSYEEICHENKLMIMRNVMASPVNRTIRGLSDILFERDGAVDINLGAATREVIANFHVYRTYIRPADGVVSVQDQMQIDHAVDAAIVRRPDIDTKTFEQIRDVLLLKDRGPAQSEFVQRFQQATGPIKAKAEEDTSFYQYNRFLAKNEVGNCPAPRADDAVPSTLIQEFHAYCADVQINSQRQMNATSTHDTKRSEDVRARLSVLSEMPEKWESQVFTWAAYNEQHKTSGMPDRNLEYAIYQTMVGSWPIDETRMQGYVLKAMKEAKQETSWLNPNTDYETATKQFITNLYADKSFTASMDAFVAPLVEAGYKNSLTQTMLKATSPGIPDYYQGNERWNFRNVDPDNRQPGDFDSGKAVAETLRREHVEDRLKLDASGKAKEWQMAVTLAVRHDFPKVFNGEGTYQGLAAAGPNADHIVAQLRGDRGGTKVLAVAPILQLSMKPNDTQTTLPLPEGNWINRLTGDRYKGGQNVRVSDLLEKFPTALLVRSDIAVHESIRPSSRLLLGHLDITPAAIRDPVSKPIAARSATLYTPGEGPIAEGATGQFRRAVPRFVPNGAAIAAASSAFAHASLGGD
jgi:(1->4)-alpha-D-glucan 1-alpha-D-glucosylmutase